MPSRGRKDISDSASRSTQEHVRLGLLACRCPGKFLAEAEVALISLLLLSEHRVGLSTAESPRDNEKVATHSGMASCGSRDGHSLAAIQQDCWGTAEPDREQTGAQLSCCIEMGPSLVRDDGVSAMPASSCNHASETLMCHSVAELQQSTAMSPGTSVPGDSSCHEQAMHKCKMCRQMLNEEERSSTEGRLGLPLPELRRQVGIRWPQHDMLVSLR